MMQSQFKNQASPPDKIMTMMGGVNLLWARLDGLTTACLRSILTIDTIEFLYLVGRLDAQAKLQKVKQILARRGDPKVQKIAQLIKVLEKLKEERNAITHGFYLGMTEDDRIVFSIYSDIVDIEKGLKGVRLHVTDQQSLSDHAMKMADAVEELVGLFEREKLRELLSIPASELPPKL